MWYWSIFRCIPGRYIIVFIGFLGFAVLNAQRVNIALALEVMTNSTKQTKSSSNHSEYAGNSSTKAVPTNGVTFDWDSKTQGYIISSSFIGFVLTQILGGRLAERLGAKEMLCFSILCASFCNVISPLAAKMNVLLFIGAQFTKGAAQGILQPAVSCLMARWYPKDEMSFLSSLTYSGFPAGALIGGIASGALCNSSIFDGWPAVFYIFGMIGTTLAVLEIMLVYNSPEEYNPRNSYSLETRVNENKIDGEMKLKTPWLKIMISIPTWALLAGMVGQYWMTFYFISVHPAYLSDVLNLNISDNGLYSSLPYVIQILVTWLGSFISDYLTRKDYASTDTVRKYCNTLSCLGFSLSMLGVVFANSNLNMNILCFFIAMASIGLGYPGSLTVPMDMTKNFAGTLVGLSGTVASSSGFIIPVLVGHITDNEGSFQQWCKMIYISVAVVMISAIVFHLFGSAQLQSWDGQTTEEPSKCPEKKEQDCKSQTLLNYGTIQLETK